MKISKKKMALIIAVLVFLIAGIHIYLIQGERLDKEDLSWVITTPIAHRGLHNESENIPENSMASFKEAIANGYTVELDVQLSKDKQIIVFHDSSLERMTGDSRKVSEVNYDEIKKLTLNNTQETIPTLKDVLELVDNQVPLAIEIKDGKNAKELAQKTYEVVKDYEGRFFVQSFNPFILEHFKNMDDSIIRCQLSSDFKGEQNDHLKWYEKFILKNLLLNFKSKPHIVAYDLKSLNNLSVTLFEKTNPIISWTIKNEEDMKLAYEKTDNIIFDNIRP